MKLIRDKIPALVSGKEGVSLNCSTANNELFPRLLEAKLLEEISEYLTSRDPAELIDILEVVYAFGTLHQMPPEDLERLRRLKVEERGGFAKRYVLHD